MTILFGIDPGGTTGFVHIEIGEDRKIVSKNACEMKPAQVMSWYGEMLSFEMPAILVIEDYIIDPKTHGYDHQGDKGVALRLLGAAQLLCQVNPNLTYVPQWNFRKPLGYGYSGKVYVRGKRGQHIQDALAHVMYYAVSHNLTDPVSRPVTGNPKPVRKQSGPRIYRAQSHSEWRRPSKGS